MWGLEHTVLTFTLFCFELCLSASKLMRAHCIVSRVGDRFWSGVCPPHKSLFSKNLFWKNFSFERFKTSKKIQNCWLSAQSSFGNRVQILVHRNFHAFFNTCKIEEDWGYPGVVSGIFVTLVLKTSTKRSHLLVFWVFFWRAIYFSRTNPLFNCHLIL